MATRGEKISKALMGNQNARKYKDENELKALIDDYFEDCDRREAPYTMSGLAYFLGIDRITLINYGKEESFFTLIKNAKDRVQRQIEENALSGKYNATFTIFTLKNNYNWKDQQEIKQTSEVQISPLGEALQTLVESTKE